MMGHTRSTQQRSYNLMSSSEKTVSAHNDLQDWTSVMTMDLNVAIANNMQQVVPSRASQPPQSLVTLFNSPANVGSNSMGSKAAAIATVPKDNQDTQKECRQLI